MRLPLLLGLLSPIARRILPLIPAGLSVLQVLPAPDHVSIIAVPASPRGSCPLCGMLSNKIHSHSTRTLADLPWQGRTVLLLVRYGASVAPQPAVRGSPDRRGRRHCDESGTIRDVSIATQDLMDIWSDQRTGGACLGLTPSPAKVARESRTADRQRVSS
jgi:transposase IS204/IS1001/IS1096/IS1165 family protein